MEKSIIIKDEGGCCPFCIGYIFFVLDSQCPNKKLLYILFLASALKKRSMNLGSKYKKFLDLGTSVLLIPLTSALNLQQSLIFAPFEKRKFR